MQPNCHGTALGPAEFAQPLREGRNPAAPRRNPWPRLGARWLAACRLLRPRRDRQRDRPAAEQRNELAASHVAHEGSLRPGGAGAAMIAASKHRRRAVCRTFQP